MSYIPIVQPWRPCTHPNECFDRTNNNVKTQKSRENRFWRRRSVYAHASQSKNERDTHCPSPYSRNWKSCSTKQQSQAWRVIRLVTDFVHDDIMTTFWLWFKLCGLWSCVRVTSQQKNNRAREKEFLLPWLCKSAIHNRANINSCR